MSAEAGSRTRNRLVFLAILVVLTTVMLVASRLIFVGLDERVHPQGPTGVREAEEPTRSDESSTNVGAGDPR